MSESDGHGHMAGATTVVGRWFLFFALFFLIVWLWIDPKLIYYAHGWMLQYPIYFPGMPTFEDMPYAPGAASRWAAGFCSHYYYYSAAGAAILTAVTWLSCFGADRFIVALGGGRWLRWLTFLPAFAVFAQHGRYSHFLQGNMSLALGLLFLYAYTRLRSKRAALLLVVFMVLSAAMYLAAVSVYGLFVLMAVLFDLFRRRRWPIVIAELCVGSAIPLAASAVLVSLPIADAFALVVPRVSGSDLTACLPLLSIALILPVAAVDWLVRRVSMRGRKSASSGDSGKGLPPGRVGVVRWSVATLALLLAFGVFAWLSSDSAIHRSMRFNCFMRRHMWGEALAEARLIPAKYFTNFICHDVNRALFYSQGGLAYDMFSFPQTPRALQHSVERSFAQHAYRRAELLFELGHFNAAEHLSHETLEVANYNPWTLRRLAMINMVKKMPDAAGVFLRALAKDFVHRDWALQQLARLEADPQLDADRQMQVLRSLMPIQDAADSQGHAAPLRALLVPVFARNLGNRMAFEYGMALNLLIGRPAAVVRGLPYLDRLGYRVGEIPRHYEEAILLHEAMTGKAPDLAGRSISSMTSQRFDRFMSGLLGFYSADSAANGLREDFGDTYYYYVAFTLNGYQGIVIRLTQ